MKPSVPYRLRALLVAAVVCGCGPDCDRCDLAWGAVFCADARQEQPACGAVLKYCVEVSLNDLATEVTCKTQADCDASVEWGASNGGVQTVGGRQVSCDLPPGGSEGRCVCH